MVLLGACDASVTGHDPKPADRGYEAEVALAVGHSTAYDSPVFSQWATVVLAFNDQRPTTLATGQPEWEWFGGDSGFEQVRFRRGASFMGWAWGMLVVLPPTSLYDSRLTWQYGGKLRPPAGTSMIYADPSVASFQPYFPYLMYMAFLGISDGRWDVRSNGADEIVVPGSSLSPDQFCVARSVNGGQTFQAPTCTGAAPFDEAQLVDKTSIAIDIEGRAWIAVEVRGLPHPEPDGGATGLIRLYRNRGVDPPESAIFDEVPIAEGAVAGLGNRDPVLRASPDGQVISLSSLLEPTAEAEPAHLRWLTLQVPEPYDPVGVDLSRTVCAPLPHPPRRADGGVRLGGGAATRTLRTGVRASHAPGLDGDTGVIRFAYEYLTGDLAQVQLLELREDPAAPAEIQCVAPPTWTSAYPGPSRESTQAFQPQISYHMRELRPWIAELMSSGRGVIPPRGAGANREWQVAWYGTLNTEDTVAPDVQVVTSTLLPGSTTTAWLVPVTDVVDNACPVPANDYWGDYFGLGQYYDHAAQLWWNVAGYSSSDPAGEPGRDCFQRAGWYASPLHVGASTWPSLP
ncbi:MAG: hypothetical protein IT376_15765 [Polyangiaceae bacterium]|nr:hypothetical protein [Polyangiaceae bacterium]